MEETESKHLKVLFTGLQTVRFTKSAGLLGGSAGILYAVIESGIDNGLPVSKTWIADMFYSIRRFRVYVAGKVMFPNELSTNTTENLEFGTAGILMTTKLIEKLDGLGLIS